MNTEPDCTYEFGPFRLDAVERCLFKDGEFIQLPATVFDILLLLVQNRGRVVTKEDLLSIIWASSFVEENNLTVRMSALRKVLCRDEKGRPYVETVYGQGYRFVARVRQVTAADEPLHAAGGVEDRRAGAAAEGEPLDSVAVFPFSDEGGGPNLGSFADGITRSIIDLLSKVPGLNVPPQSAVAALNGLALSPHEAGRAMGVRAVLIGRAVRMHERLVVEAELLDSDDGSQLWGGLYHKPLLDPAAALEEVASEVTAKLRSKLAGRKPAYARGGPPRPLELAHST